MAMSRHEPRQKLAREFGATDIVTERGEEGVARIKDLTKGVGADSVLECVGTKESMMQAIGVIRPGGRRLRRRPARRGARWPRPLLPACPSARWPRAGAPLSTGFIDRILNSRMNPGKVFDLTLPLHQVAEGYRAMDERRAIKTLLRP